MTNEELIATIRNKVERQFSVFLNLSNASQEYGYHKALEFVLSVLSDIEKSLPAKSASGSSEIPKDLEEAAWKYAPDLPSYNIGGGYLPPQSRDDLRTAFKDGAEWQKEQMMKEAVEGKIIFLLNGDVAINIGDMDEYKLGDKVRVIIVKEG